jgi:hypothetical protein
MIAGTARKRMVTQEDQPVKRAEMVEAATKQG